MAFYVPGLRLLLGGVGSRYQFVVGKAGLLRSGEADGFVALTYKLVEAVLSFGLWFCLLLFPKGGGAGLAAALSPTSCDVPAIGLKWAAAILANSRYIGHCSSGLKWNFGAFFGMGKP